MCVTTYARTHVLIDVMGYFSPVGSGLFHSLTPVRLADTRAIGHRLAAFEVWPLTIAGAGGVPSGATGVVLNVTAVNPGSDGYVTVYPCGGSVPLVSSLNYVGGANVPNFVAVGLGQGGAVCFSSYADSDVIVDVSGYYQ